MGCGRYPSPLLHFNLVCIIILIGGDIVKYAVKILSIALSLTIITFAFCSCEFNVFENIDRLFGEKSEQNGENSDIESTLSNNNSEIIDTQSTSSNDGSSKIIDTTSIPSKPNNSKIVDTQSTPSSANNNNSTTSPKPQKTEEFEGGDTTGNYKNQYACATFKDDVIYYATEEGVYKVNNDGSGQKLLYKIPSWKIHINRLSVHGKWLYFMFVDKTDWSCKFVRIKTDGSMGKKYQVVYENVYELQIINNHFYYINLDDNTLHRADLNRKNDEILIKHKFLKYSVQITKDKIYFDDEFSSDLYEADLDGKNLKCYEDVGARDWLIYKGKKYTTGDALECENIDGTNTKKLTEGYCHEFVIRDDWIYYTESESFSTDAYLYKMKIDGSQKQRLNDRFSSSFVIVGDWLYYKETESKYDSDGSLLIRSAKGMYRIRLDGTEDTKLA